MAESKRTILLYGRTRAGKSTQIGELAEYVKRTTGKNTRLYTGDRGGVGPLQPHIDYGLIEVVAKGDSDPWIFWNQAARGRVRDDKGKWVDSPSNTNIGLFAFESMTAFADDLMQDMAKKAGSGTNIGGGGNVAFQVAGDGESLKISGSNMAMYGVAQTRVTEEVWNSQKLDAPFVLWTASASKDEDPSAGGKVLGPAVAGKALTSEVPRWFNLTFRIDCLAASGATKERHILYLGNYVDVGAGNAVGLGNTRTAMGAPDLPSTIEPASIVKAIELIDGGYSVAFENLKKRLGTK